MAIVRNKGFTLIELVIGMVVLVTAMLFMNTVLVSQSKHSLSPLHQLRAAQFANSLLLHITDLPYAKIPSSLLTRQAKNSDGFNPISAYQSWLGYPLGKEYRGYLLKVNMTELIGVYGPEQIKQIDVTIKTPDQQSIVFSVLKGMH